ncbi:MAG: multicopper oxidase domain-containing protein [Acidimicrobiia bacterium]|nr:multicopper oxidase domain-containing protein [Acidimicrobiia bacterium]
MPSPAREDRHTLSIFAALAAVAAFTVAVLGVIVAATSSDGSGSAASGPVAVSLDEFTITPAMIHATAGEVTLAVTNNGMQVHDLEVVELGIGTPDLAPGESTMLDLGEVAPGTYTVICTIAGHEELGMVGTLMVGDDLGDAELAGHGGSHSYDWEATEAAHAANLDAFLEAAVEFGTGIPTEGTGNQPLEHTVDGEFKVFELEASIIEWEVEPGKFVEGWAYNEQIPGPWIHVEPGDLVRVNFTNNLPFGTDIHFHGITTPFMADGVAPLTQPVILPDEDFVYEFRVPNRPEVGMYHAHMHGNHAVPNGLFGVFTVGQVDLPRGQTISGITIPEDLEITQELPMVLNDAGTIGLTLNGKSYPATDPIFTTVGDAVLLHYYNEGLMEHPMHLHHIPQIVVAKDGWPLEQPFVTDTLNVAPGERWSVLVLPTFNDLNLDIDGNLNVDAPLGGAGIWAFHCHILTHAEGPDGLAWMTTAWVVLPEGAG